MEGENRAALAVGIRMLYGHNYQTQAMAAAVGGGFMTTRNEYCTLGWSRLSRKSAIRL